MARGVVKTGQNPLIVHGLFQSSDPPQTPPYKMLWANYEISTIWSREWGVGSGEKVLSW